ncbi:TRAP transporter substrate-binding protein DctP [Sulfitobacter sp. MOLA879]|uniref:TRAP transporter substrate-binding protein DctP n=1 Tax=Sulfitobacter sp. MOLA879 TaxID=3368579 RepID=UPI003745A624
MKLSKLITTALCLSWAGLASTAIADSVSWRATSPYPAGTNSGPAFEAMRAELAERTDGAFELALHPGASLGFSGAENLGVVQDGIVEVAETLVGDLVGSEPLFGVLSLPFLTADIADIESAMAALTSEFDALLANHDQIMLGWGAFSGVGIFTKEPITSAEQIAGKKLRTYDAFSSATANSLGAVPVQLPFSEVVTAISAGTIDGLIASPTGGKAIAVWDLGIGAYTDIEYSIPITILHVSRPAFEALSADKQAALREAAAVYSKTHWTMGQDAMAGDIAMFAENGMTVVSNDDLSPEFKAALSSIGKTMRADWVAQHGDKARALIELATQ